VCGMTVDPETTEHHRHYEGGGYVFCGQGCAEAFDAEPARYAKSIDARSGGGTDDRKLP
jgi:YHS domain-containing protein